jgi:hypothetical protein
MMYRRGDDYDWDSWSTLDPADRSMQYQQVLVVMNRMITFTSDDGQHREFLKSPKASSRICGSDR